MRSQGPVASMLLAVVLLGCARNDPATDAGRAPPVVLNPQAVDISSASLVGTASLAHRQDHSTASFDMADGAVSAPEGFSNGACAANCTGHDAGYEWAEQNAIADPNDCGGDSDSFVEGCMAYAQELGRDRDSYAE